jgi:hypothetical protein
MPSLAGRIQLWLAATILVAAFAVRPAFAASLRADLDGDGSVDRVIAPGAEPGRPAALLVTLSGSPFSQRLATDAPVVGLMSVDIDADGDLDLLASTATGVRFWLNVGQGRLAVANEAPRLWRRVDLLTLGVGRHAGQAPRGAEAVFERDLGLWGCVSHEVPAASSTFVEADAAPLAPSSPVERKSSRGPPWSVAS